MSHSARWFSVGVAVLAGTLALSCAKQNPWQKVQRVLADSKDIVVLDGTEKAPLRYEGKDTPSDGDWLVVHSLADPENFNPYTSSDAGASAILAYVFESLLFPENESPYALKGWLAKEYPKISDDKLSYTFELRDNAKYADGQPVTAEDVLFSMKAIQNPKVLAPHRRNYFEAVRDMQIDGAGKITITFSDLSWAAI